MSSDPTDLDDLERRMTGAVEALKKEYAGLRTGRAHAGMLDSIVVDAYGVETPLAQVGSVSVPEPRMLSVQVWDKTNVSAVEKAIRNSDLGLNPMIDGQLVRIPVPELTEERRKDLAKVARGFSENAKIAVRNVRRDGMDGLKKAEKDGDISKDDHHVYSDEVQALTDAAIKAIDEVTEAKEKDIMSV